MLQQPAPQDYVIGTGQTHSVRELVGDRIRPRRTRLAEARQSPIPEFMRPAEVDLLQADPSKARRELGWTPTVSFDELVAMMVDADLERLSARK